MVTDHLGLQFLQDDQAMPITRSQRYTEYFMIVRLKRAPFEIILPGRLTKDIDNGALELWMTVSDDVDLFDTGIEHGKGGSSSSGKQVFPVWLRRI